MKRVVFLTALLSAVGLVTAVAAYGGHGNGTPEVAPTLVSKEVANACSGGVKIEDPVAGGYDLVMGSFTIHLDISFPGGKLQFISPDPNEKVTMMIVKGGPDNGNNYNYSGMGGIAHDDGLVAPTNPNNGKPYGFSHLCVYAVKVRPA